MKKHLLFITFFILSIFPVFAQTEVGPIDVKQRCKDEGAYQCVGACFDGWSMACYYDAANYTIEKNLNLEVQKDKCYAFYNTSACTPCRNIYLIEGKEVDCEKFYHSINEMNKKCSGCLRLTFSAGG